jgi:hypothetical protein
MAKYCDGMPQINAGNRVTELGMQGRLDRLLRPPNFPELQCGVIRFGIRKDLDAGSIPAISTGDLIGDAETNKQTNKVIRWDTEKDHTTILAQAFI